MAALTRISNNQAQSNSIHADKLQRYTLTGDVWANNLVYDSTLTVANLVVFGNSTVINSVNTTISDPIIEINAEYTGAPTLDQAVLFGRGDESNVGLVWKEQDQQQFQLIYTTATANANPGTITADSFANLQVNQLTGDGVSLIGNLTAYWVNATNYHAGGSMFVDLDLDVTGNVNANWVNANNFHAIANVYFDQDAVVVGNIYATDGSFTDNVYVTNAVIVPNLYSSGDLGITAGDNVYITANNTDTDKSWIFGLDGNLTTPGNLTVIGDVYANTGIYSGNVIANSFYSVGPSGNIAGADFVIANYYVGNGFLLTGMYSNVNVGEYLPIDQTIIDLWTNAAVQSANIDALWDNAAVQSANIDALWTNAAVQSANIDALWTNAAVQSANIDALWTNAAIQSANIDALWDNAAVQSANIDALWDNAAVQSANIDALWDNAAVQSANIDALWTNAAVQSANIDALWNNAAVQSANIDALWDNAAVQSANIDLLWTNAAVQSANIDALWNNAAVQSANIAALWTNAAVQSANIDALWTNAAVQSANIDSLWTNVSSIGSNIAALWTNAAVQSANIDALWNNAAVQSANIAALWTNAAVQSANIAALWTNAAVQSANIDALWSNAAVQDQEIGNIISGDTTLTKVTTTLDANIGGNVNTSNWVNTNNINLSGALFANANSGLQGQYLTSTGTGAYWASHFYNDAVPPDTPNYGDIWYYLDENKLYMWVTDGASDFWYDFLPPTF